MTIEVLAAIAIATLLGVALPLVVPAASGLVVAIVVAAVLSLALGSGDHQAPQPLAFVAMTLIGASLGGQVSRESVIRLRALGPAGACAILSSVASGIVIGLAVHWIWGIDASTAILATAPGGSSGMVASSLALGVSPIPVAILHLVRQVAVATLIPVMFTPLIRYLEQRAGEPE